MQPPHQDRQGRGTYVWASRAVPRARTSLGQARDITGRAAKGRPGWALLTRYAIGYDTIGSRRFIAAVTWSAGPRPFGGAGLFAEQWLGGRDSELTCVCSRIVLSNGLGDSYPAAESHANIQCEADLERSRAQQQI